MRLSLLRWIAPLGLAALVGLAACAGTQPGGGGTSPAPQPSGQGDRSAAAKARADSARYPYTEADVQFMSQMIGHHAQALVMAGWAPTHGAGPAVRRLAERIINGQQDEIAAMQRWLRDRSRPVPQVDATGAVSGMATHGQGHEHHMPGMLTQSQMEQLDQARGTQFDQLFLRSMIQHHRGAVSMVRELVGTPGAAQEEAVFKLASDINVDQATEIARMERMLAETSVPAGP